MSDEEERDRAITERLEQIDRCRIARGFDRTGEIDADLVWMRDRINEYRALLSAAREAGRAEGDQAARRDIYEAIMQPGANDAARRSGFTGHEGAVWATGYVAGKLECSRLAIADDDEWSRLARARAQYDPAWRPS